MSINPYESSQTAGEPAVPSQRAVGFTLVELFVVIAIIGMLVAMLLPNVRSAREPARRAQCMNNLKQIGLALHNYHDEYGCLPPAYTVDAEGKPLHSWRTLILPFLEHKPLYESIDLNRPWDDPANQAAFETRVSPYVCPSSDGRARHTRYLAVVGPTSCLQADRGRRLDEITDDRSLTLMVIEVADEHAVHWMSPVDASEDLLASLAAAKRQPHPHGAQGLFADMAVRILRGDTKPEALRALVSIAGNDDDLARRAQ